MEQAQFWNRYAIPPLYSQPQKVSFDQVEQFLRSQMLPETLEAFLEERERKFRRLTDPRDGSVSWSCVVCQKIFTKKGSAKRHCDTTHIDESDPASNRVECPICLHKFSRRDDLYAHMRRVHHSQGGDELVSGMIHNKGKRSKTPATAAAAAQPMRLNLVSHEKHLDVLLPSGGVICPPEHTHEQRPVCCDKNSAEASSTHIRVIHDDHEDVLVNGTLQHFNERGVWEKHGDLLGMEFDLDFLCGRSGQDLWEEDLLKSQSSAGGMETITLPQGSQYFKTRDDTRKSTPSLLTTSDDCLAINEVLDAIGQRSTCCGNHHTNKQ